MDVHYMLIHCPIRRHQESVVDRIGTEAVGWNIRHRHGQAKIHIQMAYVHGQSHQEWGHTTGLAPRYQLGRQY